MEDCLFCKIVEKEIPAELVFENDNLIAFEDINPQAPTHILIIPKEHFASLKEIPEDKKEILAELLLAARQIAEEKALDCAQHRRGIWTSRFPYPFPPFGGKENGLASRIV